MHLFTLTLLFITYASFTASAPFWAVFEQTSLTDILTSTSSSIKTALKEASIIPDILPSSFDPTHRIHLSYPSTHDYVDLGNTIPTSNVTKRPVFGISTLKPDPSATVKNATYTLVLTDPDATSRAEPVKAQMCHWIITGLKLDSSSDEGEVKALELPDWNGLALPSKLEGEKTTGAQNLTEIMSYLPPAPPPKTGYHRYVFVLLAPREGKSGDGELSKPKDRPHWGYGEEGKGVEEWAEENGLVAVGANFFYSENEEQ